MTLYAQFRGCPNLSTYNLEASFKAYSERNSSYFMSWIETQNTCVVRDSEIKGFK